MQFTRSVGEGLAARGVRLAALCPQYVDTPFVAHYNRDGALPLLTPARVRGAFPFAQLVPAKAVLQLQCLLWHVCTAELPTNSHTVLLHAPFADWWWCADSPGYA